MTVIAGYARSPFTPARKGSLARTRPDDIAATVVDGLLQKLDLDPELIDIDAACLLCLKIEISFIAIDFFTLPDLFFTIISNGCIEIILALTKFFIVFFTENLFIKNP